MDDERVLLVHGVPLKTGNSYKLRYLKCVADKNRLSLFLLGEEGLMPYGGLIDTWDAMQEFLGLHFPVVYFTQV
jgi:hypothetical protein